MTDREKVIVGIEHCDKLGCSMCPYKPGGYSPMDCRIQLMRDALALLKEQDAVEPKEGTDPNESHWNCGACGYPLWEDENYCAHCGKRVLWEGR